MNAITDAINDAIETELTAANENHPPFASLHEGYAVIREEVEEAAEEMNSTITGLEELWRSVKLDEESTALQKLHYIKHSATNLAIEACQVAAMAEKAVQSVAETRKKQDKILNCGEEQAVSIHALDNFGRLCASADWCGECPLYAITGGENPISCKECAADPIIAEEAARVINEWCAKHPENPNCRLAPKQDEAPKKAAETNQPFVSNSCIPTIIDFAKICLNHLECFDCPLSSSGYDSCLDFLLNNPMVMCTRINSWMSGTQKGDERK